MCKPVNFTVPKYVLCLSLSPPKIKPMQLLTPSSRDEWQAHGLSFHVICEKPGRGVDIMVIDTSTRPSPPDYPINFGQRGKTKIYLHCIVMYRIVILIKTFCADLIRGDQYRYVAFNIKEEKITVSLIWFQC